MEGNVASFLGMSGKSDGTGSYSRTSGDYKSRRQNATNHYYRTTQNVDPDTGEVLNFVPKRGVKNPYKTMAYRNFKKPNLKLPNPDTLINVGILAAIGIGGYKLYNLFFGNKLDNAISDVKTEAEKKVASTYVDTTASKIDVLKQSETSLASKGLIATTQHKSLANTIHAMLDVMSVDEDKIVKTILGMHVQTFRLVAISYGSRELPTYCGWHIGWMFSSKKFLGTLKDHLLEILGDSDKKKISAYLSVI